MISKILVTGSNGTIGTRLCEQLLAKKFDVIGVDWKHNKWNKDVEKITIIGDLRDKKTFDKLPKDVDLIIHLAANALVYKSVVDPDLAFDNITTIYNTLEFARKNGIKKFMFASSREVYGNTEKVILKEEEAHIDNCESPYAASKISGEALSRAYGRCFGIDFVILRFSNVYGMYDDSDRVIPLFIRQCKHGHDLTVFGEDKMLDFTYIDDTINGVIKCIEKFESIKDNTVNIAYGQGSSILKVAELIKKHFNSENKVIIKNVRTGEVVKYIADISKIKKLEHMSVTNIDEGIKKSVEWYNQHTE
ncbi:MAG: NAD-dependent epimerase/dehydratase family protein [Candidatus Woesearchaeota archaeon]